MMQCFTYNDHRCRCYGFPSCCAIHVADREKEPTPGMKLLWERWDGNKDQKWEELLWQGVWIVLRICQWEKLTRVQLDNVRAAIATHRRKLLCEEDSQKQARKPSLK